MTENLTNINWYPGHMNKALKNMEKDIKVVDTVLYVLDARAPFSSFNPKFKKIIGDKPIIYILNKIDLADDCKTKEWSNYLNRGNDICIPLNSVMSGAKNKIENAIKTVCKAKIEKFASKNISLIIRAMVLGIPNSGKSTLTNNLCGSGKAKTANMPGVTKVTQWVRLGNQIEILDTPGTLWPVFENEKVAHHLAYIGSISEDVLDISALSLDFINEIKNLNKAILESRYKISITDEYEAVEILEKICKSRGFLIKGGDFDYERGAYALINDFKQGKLGKITLERIYDISKLKIRDRKNCENE